MIWAIMTVSAVPVPVPVLGDQTSPEGLNGGGVGPGGEPPLAKHATQ
jgi:hypothetical protein